MTLDPSQTGSSKAGIFGLPFSSDESRVIILPVTWDVTTSYGGGAALGPGAVLKASPQIDLFDAGFRKEYLEGFHLLDRGDKLLSLNNELLPLALHIRSELEEQASLSQAGLDHQDKINQACKMMVKEVFEDSKHWLAKEKIVGVLGGDHSSPEGLIQALSEKYKGQFSILHLDAHADLRQSYQGFVHSHASIMYNVMSAAWKPNKLVQVGIRDYCEEEFDMIQSRSDLVCFFDRDLKESQFKGLTWQQQCEKIIEKLDERVYISFDIDGLEPVFCPSTGTPVPGGLHFDQAKYLIERLAKSKKQIIGFDLCEVAPHPELKANEWDGNVGSRLLYQLCGWASWSH